MGRGLGVGGGEARPAGNAWGPLQQGVWLAAVRVVWGRSDRSVRVNAVVLPALAGCASRQGAAQRRFQQRTEKSLWHAISLSAASLRVAMMSQSKKGGQKRAWCDRHGQRRAGAI
jgi:hypothetical protein